MELYEITLHFPSDGEAGELTLSSKDYSDSSEAAKARARAIASAFQIPKPSFWYLESGDGRTIWTDSPKEVKDYIHYDAMGQKPDVLPISRD